MKKMKILIIGSNGQVGGQLIEVLAKDKEVIAADRSQLDLEDTATIKPFLEKNSPHLIINAAAYTAVDKAEEEPEKAEIINAHAPAVMAEYAANEGVPIIHYSTDYVFDGHSKVPYIESDPVAPQSVYGKTKLQGEELVARSGADFLILRTSWVYGLHGHNFLLTMLRLFRERDELGIVDDQIGAPTSANAIANATVEIIEKLDSKVSLAEHSGIYHLTAAGQTSWYGFANAILNSVKKEAYQCKLKPISTAQYPTPATRPPFSVLDNSKLNKVFGIHLPSWEEQLKSVMQKWHKNTQET